MESQISITVNVGRPSAAVPNAGVFGFDNQGNDAAVLNIGIIAIIAFAIIIIILVCCRKIRKRVHVLPMITCLALLLNYFAVFTNFGIANALNDTDLGIPSTIDNGTIDVDLEDEPIYGMAASTITISEATEYDYILYAYVEDVDLTSNESDQKISGLTNTEPETRLSDNTWGVALSEPTDQNSEVFMGLPTDADNPMIIKEVFGATEADDTATLYLATYVTPELEPGTYTGASMHYKAVANPGIYMQDFTKEDCAAKATSEPFTVYDRRDNSDYTVRYLNNACWMTQNLRISGTVSAKFSNFETSPYSGSDTIDLYAGGDFKDTNDTYTAPMMHVADEDDVAENSGKYTIDELGAYYNYCATSAGQICEKGQINATQDICPSGWRLPTGGGGASEHQTLVNNLGGNIALYNPVSAGGYVNTVLYGGVGYYWSSSARSATNHWDMYFHQNRLFVGNINGDYGISVRCIRTE